MYMYLYSTVRNINHMARDGSVHRDPVLQQSWQHFLLASQNSLKVNQVAHIQQQFSLVEKEIVGNGTTTKLTTPFFWPMGFQYLIFDNRWELFLIACSTITQKSNK